MESSTLHHLRGLPTAVAASVLVGSAYLVGLAQLLGQLWIYKIPVSTVMPLISLPQALMVGIAKLPLVAVWSAIFWILTIGFDWSRQSLRQVSGRSKWVALLIPIVIVAVAVWGSAVLIDINFLQMSRSLLILLLLGIGLLPLGALHDFRSGTFASVRPTIVYQQYFIRITIVGLSCVAVATLLNPRPLPTADLAMRDPNVKVQRHIIGYLLYRTGSDTALIPCGTGVDSSTDALNPELRDSSRIRLTTTQYEDVSLAIFPNDTIEQIRISRLDLGCPAGGYWSTF